MSMPSIVLIISVLVTCIIGAVIAVFASDLKASNLGYIIAYNIGIFIFVDICKVQFRKLINEDPGEPILTDDLIDVKAKSETEKFAEKQQRYRVHQEASLRKDDIEHQVRIRQDSIFSGFWGDVQLSDGFVNQSYGRQRALSSLSSAALFRPDRRRTVSTPAGIGFY
jgi:ABC-type bacteriocin/lantibiotic exporter with double-glycine peptidase domain